MCSTHTPSLVGSTLTFTLLLTAGAMWFMAGTLSTHAPGAVRVVSWVSVAAAVLGSVGLVLTVRSVLTSEPPKRDGRGDYHRPSR